MKNRTKIKFSPKLHCETFALKKYQNRFRHTRKQSWNCLMESNVSMPSSNRSSNGKSCYMQISESEVKPWRRNRKKKNLREAEKRELRNRRGVPNSPPIYIERKRNCFRKHKDVLYHTILSRQSVLWDHKRNDTERNLMILLAKVFACCFFLTLLNDIIFASYLVATTLYNT